MLLKKGVIFSEYKKGKGMEFEYPGKIRILKLEERERERKCTTGRVSSKGEKEWIWKT